MESSYYDDVDLHSLGSVENETDDSFNDELKPEENKGVENDPALWPSILKQREKEELIKKKKVQRDYLIWSQSSNSLFCFPCFLFGCENSGSYGDRSLLRWNGGIKNDWRKLSDRIKSHHSNPVHQSHYLNWKTLHSALVDQRGIDSEFQKALEKEVARWCEILRCILDAILFLTSQNLSFRGQYSSMEKNEKGNFLSCLELISHHNETLKNHLETVARHQNKGTRMQAHYLSWLSQNEFISECVSLVQAAVVKEVKDAVYFTIITNGTPDVSHTEQITFILRFVRFKSGKMIWKVKERFLSVEDMEKKKGVDIAYLICNVLAKVNLD
nr:uncharacterized protein LOC101236259 [Hydra vulgaris]